MRVPEWIFIVFLIRRSVDAFERRGESCPISTEGAKTLAEVARGGVHRSTVISIPRLKCELQSKASRDGAEHHRVDRFLPLARPTFTVAERPSHDLRNWHGRGSQ